MIEINYKEDLPAKVNSDQLQAELEALVTPPDKIGTSITYDSNTALAVEIIVYAPDDIDRNAVDRVIENHNPAKTDTEALPEKKKSDFDEQLAASPLFMATLARITELEK